MQVGPIARYLIVGLAVVAVAWLAKEAVVGVAQAYAGKTTNANVVMQLIEDINISIYIAWTVGAGGVIYGKRERTLRKQTTERLERTSEEVRGGARSRAHLK